MGAQLDRTALGAGVGSAGTVGAGASGGTGARVGAADAGVGDGIGAGTGKLLGGATLESTAKTKHETNCSGDSPVTSAHRP